MNKELTKPQLCLSDSEKNALFKSIIQRLLSENARIVVINKYSFYVFCMNKMWCTSIYEEMADLIREKAPHQFDPKYGLHSLGSSFHGKVKHNSAFPKDEYKCPLKGPFGASDGQGHKTYRKWFIKNYITQ